MNKLQLEQKYMKYKYKYLDTKMKQYGGGKKKIYFVRHGETDWNVEKRLQGCEADIALNETGKKQSLITGKYLNEYQQNRTKIDVIYCSPQIRALETARIIAKVIGYNDKIIIIDNLKEVCVGKLSGKTPQERKSNPEFKQLNELVDKYIDIKDPIIKQKKMIYYEDQISDIYGRETSEELLRRINNVLKQITESEKDKILVVTHGTIINNIFMVIGNTYDYKDGDVTNGQNCKIGYVEYDNPNYKIITSPNTLHFNLYK
jgi:probable phosphoglycerate mutase